MTVQRETLLCRYQYDPLDRVVNCAPLNQDAVQRFYRKNRLATEIQGPVRYSMFEHESQLMAQQQQREAGRVDSALLATDLQRSVLYAVAVDEHKRPVYAPYGHRSPESGLSSLLGFNGERRDPVTGHYLLGNGYRAFNPVLMRFNSPDSLSPFGRGGVNAYAYCAGDPVNRVDPTGAVFGAILGGFKDIAKGTQILISDSRNFFPSLKRPAGKPLIEVETTIFNKYATHKLAVADLNDFKNSPAKSYSKNIGRQVNVDEVSKHADDFAARVAQNKQQVEALEAVRPLTQQDAASLERLQLARETWPLTQNRLEHFAQDRAQLELLEQRVWESNLQLKHEFSRVVERAAKVRK